MTIRGLPFVFAAALVLPGAAFAASDLPGERVDAAAAGMTHGRAVIETIDAAASHVLLRYEDGTLRTYRAPAADLGELRPGDTITVDLAESVVVRWIRNDTPMADRPIAGVTSRLVGTVEEIEADGRHVLLRGAAGERHRVALPAEMDATMVQAGEAVTLEVTNAALVSIGRG